MNDAVQPKLQAALPVLFVRDVKRAAAFYHDKLGFAMDFLYGEPPFYGAVKRDGACLHLRLVHNNVFDAAARKREENLIDAYVRVANVTALYREFQQSGIGFAQALARQEWGGTDFHVRDPDGNCIAFVG